MLFSYVNDSKLSLKLVGVEQRGLILAKLMHIMTRVAILSVSYKYVIQMIRKRIAKHHIRSADFPVGLLQPPFYRATVPP
jgi:hypothetical protein